MRALLCLALLCVVMPQTVVAASCAQWQVGLESRMLKANSCWDDSECQAIYYGCPFHKGQCHVYLSGKENADERLSIRKEIAEYKAGCMPVGSAKVASCAVEDAMNVQCNTTRTLMCVNGKCVTDAHVLTEERFESKDAYGSRHVIELE